MKQVEANVAPYTPFWPLCLIALSLAVFLGWQTTLSVRQYMASVRLGEQQAMLEAQAVQTESRFQALVMDLMTLARTDEGARAIVDKYGIKFNPAPAPVPPPAADAPKPESSPEVPAPGKPAK